MAGTGDLAWMEGVTPAGPSWRRISAGPRRGNLEEKKEPAVLPTPGLPSLSSGEGWMPGCGRSEEHTSELQSLTTISYAVFCLK